jgi:methylated-DNA-[protein]-cysteine S-methyltransferase
MNDTVVEMRERLVARARREGLASVGYDVVDSPVGPLWVAMGPEGVASIHFGREPSEPELRRLVRVFGPGIVPDRKLTSQAARELDEYFEGKRRAFEIPFDLRGITPFQERVLRTTSRIGYGDVMTYAAVARKAGNEKAFRAAGGAVGSNPIPIVVPCHRVVASDGTLGGYGGGLEVKRYLLAIERAEVPPGGWPKHGS